jgi:hypothetical protein
MICSKDSTFPPAADPSAPPADDSSDGFGDYVFRPPRHPLSQMRANYEAKLDAYILDLMLPVFNLWRAEGGIEPAPPPDQPPPTAEEVVAARKELEEWEAWWADLEAAFKDEEPQPHKPRKATLVSVTKQAGRAGIDVARYEVKPDGTIAVVTGTPEPIEPGNPWPLDEFRTKETKQ